VQVVGTSICHIEEARIAEEWTYYDALGLMQQLGAVGSGGSSTPSRKT
jgi:predicted ester cyclase